MPSMFNDDRWSMKEYPRLFRVAEHARFGITRHSIYQTSRYPSVLPGIRMDQRNVTRFPTPLWADAEWVQAALRMRAAELRYPDTAACHATAAHLYGWPLPSNLTTPLLHLSSSNRKLQIRHQLVTLHRPSRMSVRLWFGLPVLAPEDVFIGIGPDLMLRDLVKLGDAAIGNWHGSPQISLNELKETVSPRPRIHCRSHLLEAITLMRSTVDSPPETDLRLWLAAVGLPEPIVHPKIYCRVLNRNVEPDLGYPFAKLALEYDGEHHLKSKVQWDSDIERDDGMRFEGWTVVRVTSRTNYRQLEAKIRHHLGLKPGR